jgi:hypothetical protein
MIGIGISNSVGAYRSFVDPAASAYFAATGLTGATERNAVNTLVTSLKSAGLWSKMKAVYPFVTDNRNLLSYTEDFGNAVWVKSDGCSVTTNSAISPIGTLTADTISFGTNTLSRIQQYPFALATYTYSVWLKTASDATTVSFGNWDDFNTITVTSDWQRFTVTKTPTTNGVFTIRNNAAGNSSDIFVWGAQLELGSSATTYQPIATTQQSYISNQFKYNLVNPVDSDAAFRGVFNGGWTFSNQGATPNGTNGYMDTYLIPSTSLTAHNIHLSYYSRTNSAVASSNTMGSASSEYCRLVVRRTSDIAFNIISDATVGLSQYTVTDSRGLFVANAPSINTRKFYQNGVVKTPVSQTTLGTNGLSTNKIVLAANNNGVILEYDNKQSAFASIGDGLTDTEATALYNAVQTFQTSLSRQV